MNIFKKLFAVNRLLIHTLLLTISSLIITATLIIPSNSLMSESYYEESLFKTNLIDFDIPNTTNEDIQLLNEQQHIDEVIPYYLTSVSINYNGIIKHNIRLMMLDNLSQIEFTMYNKKRIIKQDDVSYTNPIYIDYEYAKTNKVSLGDIVQIPFEGTMVSFNVQAITEKNTYYQGAFLALFVGDQKQLINDNRNDNLSYSGSFIVSKTPLITRTYLDGVYAQTNGLTPQEIIKLDDYAKERFDKSQQLKSSADILFFLSIIILVLIGVSINLVLLFFFKEMEILKLLKKSGTSLFKSYIHVFVIEIVIMMIVINVLSMLNQYNQILYVPSSFYNNHNMILMSTIIFIPLINLITNRVVYKRA